MYLLLLHTPVPVSNPDHFRLQHYYLTALLRSRSPCYVHHELGACSPAYSCFADGKRSSEDRDVEIIPLSASTTPFFLKHLVHHLHHPTA